MDDDAAINKTSTARDKATANSLEAVARAEANSQTSTANRSSIVEDNDEIGRGNHTAHDAISETEGNGTISKNVERVVQDVLDKQDITTEQDSLHGVAKEHEEVAEDRHILKASAKSTAEVVSEANTSDGGNEGNNETTKTDTSHFSFAKNWIESHKLQTASEARKEAGDKAKEIAVQTELHEHKRHEMEAAQSRTCNPATAPECSSMCRWLKLTDEDGSDCPLFDWQLRACQYAMPGQQPLAFAPRSLDCAVNLTRTYVLKEDVPSYMQQLDTCLQRVPKKLNATCSMAIGLVRGEVSDWKEETQYKKDAEALHQELEVACEQGRAALSTKHGEQAAIDRLSAGLSKAESLPGHYLVDEVHKARRVLDKLGPIPVARAQLIGALEDGRHAFETTELFKVKEAIAWLRVAVEKAKEYDVGEPTSDAVTLLTDLEDLRSALEVLRSAVFQGNVSKSTKSGVPEAVLSLHAAIRRAKSAGLKADLPIARNFLRELRSLEDAVDANANATRIGQLLLNETGNKGMLRLRGAVKQLNGSVAHAEELGLADNATTEDAVETLDRLTYVSHARFALHLAVRNAEALLVYTGANRSDDEEEQAIDTLEPSIEWGREVGLHRGLPVAEELLHRLESIEEAKESMNLAIATGNKSLQAKAGAGKAIKLLVSAVEEGGKQNVTAGVALAEQYLKRLRLLQDARSALGEARRLADESHQTRAEYDKSLGSLQRSVNLAESAGLLDKAKIAGNQLQKLQVFANADRELVEALQQPLREPHPLAPVKVEDPQPKHPFKRSGLKPTQLPQVDGAEDDGDEDISEHIKALEDALEAARHDGLVDSSMKAEAEILLAKQRAFRMLQAASNEGDEAIKSKKHVQSAISSLTAAVSEAGESNLTSNNAHVEEDLRLLRLIQPARDELKTAILHANVSMHTVTGMDEALTKLNKAIKANEDLDIRAVLPKANRMVQALLELKDAWVNLKAAVVQGQIALKMQEGEEQAINDLQSAIDKADKVNLHQRVGIAMNVLHELMHMNAKKQQLQAAMDPRKGWS